MELSPPAGDERRSQAPADGSGAWGDRPCVEGAAPAASAVQSPVVSQTTADRGGRRGPRAHRLSVGGDAGGTGVRLTRSPQRRVVPRRSREHARRRYGASHHGWTPESRMLLLPTNPILAALPMRVGNRRISAGLPSRWPRTHACSSSFNKPQPTRP